MSERPGIVIGTGGHVDHGKTALVRALTGVETDRWREERERGLTIDIGFAPLDLDPSVETGVVDVPGHEDFLKNMLAGATGIDVLLLAVAADEGPMPQTREHLAIARLLAIPRGVVALTKRDKVDDDWLDLAEETTRELLDEDPSRVQWPIVPVSATTGEGLDDLRRALRSLTEGARARRDDDLFRLPIDRAFSIHGTGTVVTGTVWSGAVEVGETVRLFPGGEAARVRGLQVHEDPRERVTAGRRCALALVGVSPSQADRGGVLVSDDAWRTSERLGVRVRTLEGSGRVVEHGQRVRVYLGTREVMARVLTRDREPIAPGAVDWAVLALEAPLLARARDRAILRFYSPVATIGGVRIVDLRPPRDWAGSIEAWGQVLDGTPAEALFAVVGLAGLHGVPAAEAPLRLGRSAAEIEAVARESCTRLGTRWFSRDAVPEARAQIERVVARLHAADRRAAAVSKEAVRSEVAALCAPELAERAVRELLNDGGLVEDGPRLALPGHAPELTNEEVTARDRLSDLITTGGLQPPRVSDLGRTLRLSRPVLDDLLRLLREDGVTRAVTPEIHVSTAALNDMEARVRDLLTDGEAAAPTVFKEAFGLSRKYLIPLLEYLDRERITQRTGKGRVLVPRRS